MVQDFIIAAYRTLTLSIAGDSNNVHERKLTVFKSFNTVTLFM